jgi:peptidoglycan/LPS O-acetylase OafA/YrhL
MATGERALLVSDAPNNFNLIRITMALLVVWSHSYALNLGSESAEPISRLTAGLFNAGKLGVYVFFVVSGFLITQSFDRSRSPWSYLKKRVARIHPGYMVATSLCAFVLLPCYAGTAYTATSVLETIGWNLLLQGRFPNDHPFANNPYTVTNGSLWSIPFEFWCYLGVLAIGVMGLLKIQKRHFVLMFYVLLVTLHIWIEAARKNPGLFGIGRIIGWPYEWFTVLPCFMAGMLIYLYREKIRRIGWMATIGPVILIAASHLPCALSNRLAINAVLFPPVISYGVFYLAFSPQICEAARFGDFSYGTYLYAFPIQQLLKAEFSLSMPEFICASMLLSVLAGILSWHAVERWFHRAAKPHPHRITESREAAGTAVAS